MKKCPKCGYERKPADVGGEGICSACGLVFSKWAGHTLGTARLPREREEPQARDQAEGRLGALVMLIAFAWGTYLLLQQYRNLDGTD